ncbi:MAG: integrase core domain-containing protein, partial [Alphaproteobacteria bacterium]|nr:integrase core domain-containing protein [Alphaproteobacteria bacterium]
KPTYNGKIERSNRVFRKEFYANMSEDTIVGAHRELINFMQKYNSYRPYASLRGLTPLECISKYSSGDHLCLTSVGTWTG